MCVCVCVCVCVCGRVVCVYVCVFVCVCVCVCVMNSFGACGGRGEEGSYIVQQATDNAQSSDLLAWRQLGCRCVLNLKTVVIRQAYLRLGDSFFRGLSVAGPHRSLCLPICSALTLLHLLRPVPSTTTTTPPLSFSLLLFVLSLPPSPLSPSHHHHSSLFLSASPPPPLSLSLLLLLFCSPPPPPHPIHPPSPAKKPTEIVNRVKRKRVVRGNFRHETASLLNGFARWADIHFEGLAWPDFLIWSHAGLVGLHQGRTKSIVGGGFPPGVQGAA